MEKQLNMPQPPPPGHPTDTLWQKIDSFQMDDPTATFPFSKKLAKENSWDEALARQAIKEYKRFVYLCCVSPDGASPSYIVDQVWHLHLCYTVNYWEEFCDQILCRKLHHHPSKGGKTEHQKHNDWHERTLILYRQTFNEEPPTDIWQTAKPLKKQSQVTQKISKLFQKKQFLLATFTLLLFPLISGCNGDLSFMLVPFVIIVILIIVYSASADDNREPTKGGNDGGGGGGGCGSGGGSSCGGGGCGGCGGCGG